MWMCSSPVPFRRACSRRRARHVPGSLRRALDLVVAGPDVVVRRGEVEPESGPVHGGGVVLEAVAPAPAVDDLVGLEAVLGGVVAVVAAEQVGVALGVDPGVGALGGEAAAVE